MSAVGAACAPLVNLYSKKKVNKNVYNLIMVIKFESNGKYVTFTENYKDYLEEIRISKDEIVYQGVKFKLKETYYINERGYRIY